MVLYIFTFTFLDSSLKLLIFTCLFIVPYCALGLESGKWLKNRIVCEHRSGCLGPAGLSLNSSVLATCTEQEINAIW
jgi:hypothetical protein